METTSVADVAALTLQSVASVHPLLSPEDVKLLLVTLKDDPVLKPALGVTPTDPRIYSYYQPSAIIDAARPAYITYALTALPEATQAVDEPVFTLAIWALDMAAMRVVRDRLVIRLTERPLTLANGTPFWGSKASERDSYQENTKFTGRQLVYRFGFSKV